MAKSKKNGAEPKGGWANRIIQYGMKPASQFQANPLNPRVHPQFQRDALAASLRELGWVGVVIENVQTGQLIDGHERIWQALANNDADVPFIQVDLSPEEERLMLSIYDPISALAQMDREKLGELLQGVQSGEAAIQQMLAEMAAGAGLHVDSDGNIAANGDGIVPDGIEHKSLAERFVVPPFSVLDARQGYWQERKRAWLALGIQSELGRGENIVPNGLVLEPSQDSGYQRGYSKANNGLFGESEQARSHYAVPGGSLRPAASRDANGKIVRGDGKGNRLTWVAGDRPAEALDDTSRKNFAAGRKGLARKFGQDLMRGEHVVGNSRQEADRRSNVTSAPPNQVWAVQTGTENMASGTSIFDPVLCELAYRWFCPPQGHVLDPFAGGSVRGIVAARLGRRYTGIDLRPEQVAANEVQWQTIGAGEQKLESVQGNNIKVKVSAKMARLLFNGCEPDYIRDVCHASCCDSSTSPTGTLITIHPSEQMQIEARGVTVLDGLLQPRQGERKCPFKTAAHLCGLHFTPDKPFGCIASPFTLNKNNTLIVRNRYRLLKCYNDGHKIPAYKAFRASLDLIFGLEEAVRICEHLDGGGGDMVATMPRDNYQKLVDNDAIKHGEMPEDNETAEPSWIVGDSRDLSTLTEGGFDFIFSCPPYFDLELYSEDPADLSNAGDYAKFLADYRHIIAQAVGLLTPDRFACFVVGDIRDKKGFYRNFVSDTISAFQDAGATLYNEAILVTAAGSLPLRVIRQFESGRKLGKTHQNVLCFVKGNPRKATEACGPVDVGDVVEQVSQEELQGADKVAA